MRCISALPKPRTTRPLRPRADADHGLPYLVGEMQNDLAARMAHRDMVEAAHTGEPGPATTNRVWIGRTPGRPRDG
jgi:hypothetical protein